MSMLCFGPVLWVLFFFKQKTAYEMRISDWSSDVCSSDLVQLDDVGRHHAAAVVQQLHDQVRLAVGGAAGDCGAGPGGDAGIEEVDVEADVDQSVAGLHPAQELAHRGGDAQIGRAHV